MPWLSHFHLQGGGAKVHWKTCGTRSGCKYVKKAGAVFGRGNETWIKKERWWFDEVFQDLFERFWKNIPRYIPKFSGTNHSNIQSQDIPKNLPNIVVSGRCLGLRRRGLGLLRGDADQLLRCGPSPDWHLGEILVFGGMGPQFLGGHGMGWVQRCGNFQTLKKVPVTSMVKYG